MSQRPPRLPPLGALRAFEAAARYLSFKKAAAELHVSPAAISHQISTLEGYLGVQLFERLNRGLKLSDIGRAGLANISDGFQSLQLGVERMRGTQSQALLAIGAGPAFTAKWLVPRLHRFIAAHPDIDLRIAASLHAVDGYHSGAQTEGMAEYTARADLEVRFGNGLYPGYDTHKLLAVNLTPVCSPQRVKGKHPLRAPQDLRHHPLLHDDAVSALDDHADWSAWLRLAGVTDVDSGRGAHFTHGALALQAAADDLGVALAMDVLAAADIGAERLTAPFTIKLPLSAAYYVVTPQRHSHRPPVAAFRQWLLTEAGVVSTVPTPS